ncbi:MAG TPA: TPM domain-containing protein, partial [Pirellulales bacterium]|nr:TPM domain-containing protein [Pirellulales bacterium]
MKHYVTTASKAALAAMLVVSAAFALDTSKLKPSGYVNDFAHVLDPVGRQRLEDYAAMLERATGAEMAIVTVDSLEDEPIEDVANRLYREWGIGKKGKDEGILILLAVKERKDRAEIGYGLEPVITDGAAGGILRGIRPILRQGNYAGALLAAAQEFGDRIAQSKGVQLADEPRRNSRPAERQVNIPWPVLLFGFFFLMWIIGRLGGGRSGGGGGGGFLTGMILGNMMGRGYRGGGSYGGWGGGGFGGGSGGGGFGGFGGGRGG